MQKKVQALNVLSCIITTVIATHSVSSYAATSPNVAGPFSATEGDYLKKAQSSLMDDRSRKEANYNPLRVREESLVLDKKTSATLFERVESCTAGQKFESPFQSLVCDAIGLSVPVYGQTLSTAEIDVFGPMQDAPVDADYPVAPGDELLLKVWGSVDLSSRLVVDRAGAIYIPTVGNIPVAGTPFGQLENVIGRAIASQYKNLKIAVSMGQLNAVPVYVTGFAKKPGRLTVSSASTLLNALLASGGVSEQGSLRKIELRRMGQTVGTFDLYDLLLQGDKSKDIRLQSGDVIFIPPVGAQVALVGPVKQAGIYELKGGETAQQLLALVGGESIQSSDGYIQLEQVKNRKARTARTIKNAELSEYKLQNGDILQWTPLGLKYDGVVNLRSSLGLAIRETWKPGMKISDLISSPDILFTPKYWEMRNKGMFQTARKVAKEGEKAQSGQQDEQAATIRNQLGNEINWNYAAIQRRDAKTFDTKLIGFNLSKALNKDPKNDLELQADDIVTIFTRSDLKAPSGSAPKYVTVEGEVAVPGVYQVSADETLVDVLERAGGLTADGWLYASVFTRQSVKEMQKKSLNELADEMEIAAANFKATSTQNAITAAGATAAQNDNLSNVYVNKLRKEEPVGRIVLGLKPEATLADIPAAVIEDGDRLYIPRKPSTVAVIGQVYNKNAAFIYDGNKTLGDYLNMAGGYRDDANEDQIYVLRADGSIVGSNNRGMWTKTALNQKAQPGDTLIVPQKLDKTTWMKSLMDWTQIISNFATGAAAIKVLGD